MSFCLESLPSVYLKLFMLISKSISSCFGAHCRWGAARHRSFPWGLSKMVFIIRDHRLALPRRLGCCHMGFILVSVHLGCTWEGVLHGGVEGSGPASHSGWRHGHLPRGASVSPLSSSPPALPWWQYLNICHSRFMLWGESCSLFLLLFIFFWKKPAETKVRV